MKKLLPLLILFTMVSCFEMFEPGKNALKKESLNEMKTKKAVLFIKDGNATTDSSWHVSVTDSKYELQNGENGNVFTFDSNHNKVVPNSNSINFIWLSIDSLKIEYDKNLRVFLQESKVNGIHIQYEKIKASI